MDSTQTVKKISRRRDALVALDAGLVMFLIAFNSRSLFEFGRISLVTLISICLVSAIAAGISASLLPLNRLPKETGLSLAGKTGAHVGLMTSFLSAGMLVMGVHLSTIGGALLIWLPAVLAFCPGRLPAFLPRRWLAAASMTAARSL